MQAQIVDSKTASKRKDLAGARRGKEQTIPVMFFGTLEVSWQAPRDMRAWDAGISEGLLSKANKYKASFMLAVQQVSSM